MAFTAKEKLDCVDREVRLRVRTYERLIKTGRMNEDKATREVAIMREIAADYYREVIRERRKA